MVGVGRVEREKHNLVVIQAVTFLGWLSDPFKGLSDLQLGDEKGTLSHLAGLFLFEGKKCPGFFFVNQNILGPNDVFMVFFFWGGRNECEVCFELFVPRNTFGRLARYLFGTPSFIFGLFFERHHSFGDFLRNQNFLDLIHLHI